MEGQNWDCKREKSQEQMGAEDQVPLVGEGREGARGNLNKNKI